MAADSRFITNLKDRFKRGDIVTQLIYINAGVFLVVTAVNLFLTLFNVGEGHRWMNYLMFPASFFQFLRQLCLCNIIGYIYRQHGQQAGGDEGDNTLQKGNQVLHSVPPCKFFSLYPK